jgi:hypothetical protein
MADVIATLKRLARTGDGGPVCVCAECGTRYDAGQDGCPVCAGFDGEREAWRDDPEARTERLP